MKYRLKSLKKLRRWEEIIIKDNLYYLMNGSRILICDKDFQQLDEIRVKYSKDIKFFKNFIFIDTTPGKVFKYDTFTKELCSYKKIQTEGYSSFVNSEGKYYKLDWDGHLCMYNLLNMDSISILKNENMRMGRVFIIKKYEYYVVTHNKIMILNKNYIVKRKIQVDFCIDKVDYDYVTKTLYLLGFKNGEHSKKIYSYNGKELRFLYEIENGIMLYRIFVLNENQWLALIFDNKLEVYSIDNWELLMEHEFEHISSPLNVVMNGNLLLLSLCYYCEILEIEELDN